MVKTILGRSGGGINSNRVVQSKSGWKQEPKPKAANPAGVAQMGLSHQFKPEPMLEGKGYTPGPLKPTGIANATYNAAKSGPGSQRAIYRTGTQGQYGPVAQGSTNRAPDPPATAPGKDILGMYGPERTRR